MTGNPSDYRAVIRQLPRPTLAQTERFARYVSDAHSWYKHLPIRRKVPFIFFPDPGAGMNLVRTRTGETALVEITDESTRFHYTWQKTADYRRRFGHWNYHAAYGTAFMFAGEGGVVSTAGAGLKILTDAGEWATVPADLADSGTVLVNAFVHPSSVLAVQVSLWARELTGTGLSEASEVDDQLPSTTNDVLRCLWRVLQQDSRAHRPLSDLIPAQVCEAAERTAGQREGAARFNPFLSNWDWPDERWLEELRGLGVKAELISAVVKWLEGERMRSLATAVYRKRPERPGWPTELMVAAVGLIAEERARQLLAMTDAMNRVAEAVYATTGG